MGPGGSLKSGSPGITTGSGHDDVQKVPKIWPRQGKSGLWVRSKGVLQMQTRFSELEPNLAKTL